MPLPEVVAHEKTHPEKMRIVSSCNASVDHWTTELFWQFAETSELHAPYRGAAFPMTTLLAWASERDRHRIGQDGQGLSKEPRHMY